MWLFIKIITRKPHSLPSENHVRADLCSLLISDTHARTHTHVRNINKYILFFPHLIYLCCYYSLSLYTCLNQSAHFSFHFLFFSFATIMYPLCLHLPTDSSIISLSRALTPPSLILYDAALIFHLPLVWVPVNLFCPSACYSWPQGSRGRQSSNEIHFSPRDGVRQSLFFSFSFSVPCKVLWAANGCRRIIYIQVVNSFLDVMTPCFSAVKKS